MVLAPLSLSVGCGLLLRCSWRTTCATLPTVIREIIREVDRPQLLRARRGVPGTRAASSFQFWPRHATPRTGMSRASQNAGPRAGTDRPPRHPKVGGVVASAHGVGNCIIEGEKAPTHSAHIRVNSFSQADVGRTRSRMTHEKHRHATERIEFTLSLQDVAHSALQPVWEADHLRTSQVLYTGLYPWLR